MELHFATPSHPNLLRQKATTIDRMVGRAFEIGRGVKVPHVSAAVGGVCEFGPVTMSVSREYVAGPLVHPCPIRR